MIKTMVASGYQTPDAILLYAEEAARHDNATEEEAIGYAHEALKAHEALEKTWPRVTINDRLTAAFEELTSDGIFALENAGDTMSSGWCEVGETVDELGIEPRGACFFHKQDVERAVAGHGLLLTFGPMSEFSDDDAHLRESREIAAVICTTLEHHKIPSTWNGDVDQRIQILPFTWQKRRSLD